MLFTVYSVHWVILGDRKENFLCVPLQVVDLYVLPVTKLIIMISMSSCLVWLSGIILAP